MPPKKTRTTTKKSPPRSKSDIAKEIKNRLVADNAEQSTRENSEYAGQMASNVSNIINTLTVNSEAVFTDEQAATFKSMLASLQQISGSTMDKGDEKKKLRILMAKLVAQSEKQIELLNKDLKEKTTTIKKNEKEIPLKEEEIKKTKEEILKKTEEIYELKADEKITDEEFKKKAEEIQKEIDRTDVAEEQVKQEKLNTKKLKEEVEKTHLEIEAQKKSIDETKKNVSNKTPKKESIIDLLTGHKDLKGTSMKMVKDIFPGLDLHKKVGSAFDTAEEKMHGSRFGKMMSPFLKSNTVKERPFDELVASQRQKMDIGDIANNIKTRTPVPMPEVTSMKDTLEMVAKKSKKRSRAKKNDTPQNPLVDRGNQLVDNGKPLFDRGNQLVDNGKPLFDRGNQLVDNGKPLFEEGKSSWHVVGEENEPVQATLKKKRSKKKKGDGDTEGGIGDIAQNLISSKIESGTGGVMRDALGRFASKGEGGALAKMGGGALAKAEGGALAKMGGGALAKMEGGALAKMGGKALTKLGGGAITRGLGKSLLKKIPGVGMLAGAGLGLMKALKGDFKGAALEVASGAASTIPGVGTVASMAIDALNTGPEALPAKKSSGNTGKIIGGGIAGGILGDILLGSLSKGPGAHGGGIISSLIDSMSGKPTPQVAQRSDMSSRMPATPKQDASTPGGNTPVRIQDNSFIRYQDKRVARV